MARIRSIHPGLFTDETFAPLSSDAQMLYIGLLTEADDQGIFEWKPLTIRMRLRPAKDGDVTGLLAELEGADRIRSYELNGRKYGAVRNFRKYQRPKKPNSVHPITDEFRTYTLVSVSSTEPDDDEDEQVPPKPETSPQMEDGGGKREEIKTPKAPKGASRPKDFDAWYQGEGIEGYDGYPHKIAVDQAIRAWNKRLKANSLPSLETLIEGTKRYVLNVAEQRKRQVDLAYANPGTWLAGARWLDEPAQTETPAVETATSEIVLTDEFWRRTIPFWRKTKIWPNHAGPEFGYAGCKVPPHIIVEFNLDGMTPPQLVRTA